MVKRYGKGQYGYRDYHKKVEMGKVLFGATMIIIQLAARALVKEDAYKNVLTLMAILSVLPTANVASPLLASWRLKTPSEDFYERVSAYQGRFPILFDLILTSKEAVIPVDAAALHPDGIFLYCTDPKVKTEKAERFLKEMFSQHGPLPHFWLITDEKSFLSRLKGLLPAKEYAESEGAANAEKLLKNLSM